MRTSRIARDTSRIFNALSPNARSRRSTRSRGTGVATYSRDDTTRSGDDASEIVAQEADDEAADATLGSTPSPSADIEDVGVVSTPQNTRKRKRVTTKVELSPSKIIRTTTQTEIDVQETHTSARRSSRRVKQEIKDEQDIDEEEHHELAADGTSTVASSKKSSAPKLPAKKKQLPDGTWEFAPPSNWGKIYDLVDAFRRANPIAPVDTMGCEDLFWQTSPPQQKRYHTLCALMLSSQTKDTMTAAAMQKLHTELLESPERDPSSGKVKQSCLTIQNVLDADPVRLNSCIRQVGFHNVKTKNIKRVAQILKDEYTSDIPNTIEGLISLPGVGPKMAYLTMSAAWGVTEGIGVDVHVHRITNLWGWHVTKEPEQTRAWLEGWLPREKWHHINKMLVGFGQTVCLPVGRKCGECPLFRQGLCKSEIRGWVKKEERKRVKKEKIEIKVEADGRQEVENTQEDFSEDVDVKIKEELVDG